MSSLENLPLLEDLMTDKNFHHLDVVDTENTSDDKYIQALSLLISKDHDGVIFDSKINIPDFPIIFRNEQGSNSRYSFDGVFDIFSNNGKVIIDCNGNKYDASLFNRQTPLIVGNYSEFKLSIINKEGIFVPGTVQYKSLLFQNHLRKILMTGFNTNKNYFVQLGFYYTKN